MSLLQVFFFRSLFLLVCLGVSYTMYVYTKHFVYDTLKYIRILKRKQLGDVL